MADDTRFPKLALPFAIVGGAGGWLSAGFLANPLIRVTHPGKELVAALCAMWLGGAAGALIRRWCVGTRYSYELETPSPDARAPGDTWPRHVGAVLVAGALTGMAVAVMCKGFGGPMVGALNGALCSIAFVPVCLAVLSSARRAQRARLGSIVAGSDRRAVWGILAAALSVATLEASLDWPAAAVREVDEPWPALGMAGVAALLTMGILVVDGIALGRARAVIEAGLEERSAGALDEEEAIPRLDLGLGEEMLARIARSKSAYRGGDRTVALVQGSPDQALGAMKRALRQGRIRLGLIALVLGIHAMAASPWIEQVYDEWECAHQGICRTARTGAETEDKVTGERVILSK